MEYRILGDSNLRLSAITFGAWATGGWMWGGTDRTSSVRAIKASYDHGVTSIDTAPAYGQGLSEEIVGEAIKGIPRNSVQILTKYGLRWDIKNGTFFFKSKDNKGNDVEMYKYAGRSSIIEECENSLRRLGTDYIDLYQIHWHDETTPIEETMEAIAHLIEQGKVRYAGVCNYSVEQMKRAEKTVHLISNQVQYSMIVRDRENDVVPYCIDTRKAVLAYSPLGRGLLTGKMTIGYTFGENDHRAGLKYFKDENITRANTFLTKLKPLASSKNATLAQIVLRWTIEQPGITIALVGARNVEQAVQNAKASEVKLTAVELESLNRELAHLSIE